MAVLTVRVAPDPVLLRKTAKVTKFDASLQRLIDDMFETMYDYHGVGLAANQVGVPLRILVMGIPDHDDEDKIQEYVLINAELIKKSDEESMQEGCLSIPDYRGTISRATKVRAKGLDREGKEIRIKGEGLLAQCLQHEIDHLNGFLYVDRMKEQGTIDTLHKIVREAAEPAPTEEPVQENSAA